MKKGEKEGGPRWKRSSLLRTYVCTWPVKKSVFHLDEASSCSACYWRPPRGRNRTWPKNRREGNFERRGARSRAISSSLSCVRPSCIPFLLAKKFIFRQIIQRSLSLSSSPRHSLDFSFLRIESLLLPLQLLI